MLLCVDTRSGWKIKEKSYRNPGEALFFDPLKDNKYPNNKNNKNLARTHVKLRRLFWHGWVCPLKRSQWFQWGHFTAGRGLSALSTLFSPSVHPLFLTHSSSPSLRSKCFLCTLTSDPDWLFLCVCSAVRSAFCSYICRQGGLKVILSLADFAEVSKASFCCPQIVHTSGFETNFQWKYDPFCTFVFCT